MLDKSKEFKILAQRARYIEGYEDYYIILENGRVFSKKSKKFLKQGPSACGYLTVSLCKNGKRKSHYIHCLVAGHFCEMPSDGGKYEVMHLDGDAHHNHMSNLAYGTHKENCNHPITIARMKAAAANRKTA